MDRPTNIDLEIEGTEDDVMKAVLVANERLDRDSFGFDAGNYAYQEEGNFQEQLENIYSVLGEYAWNYQGNGIFKFTAWQESYSCTDEDGIRDVAKRMIETSPKIKFQLSASGIESDDGDLCADIAYDDGDFSIEFYNDNSWDDDEETPHVQNVQGADGKADSNFCKARNDC